MRRQGIMTVKNTGKYGKGVFATRAIKKGEYIHTLTGDTMNIRDFIERVNGDKENIDDPLQVGMRTYIDLDRTSRMFNHSCDPNAALRKRSELFAIRDIPKGSEITFDYSLTVAPTDWNMKCACGADSCRKILGDVLSIPKSQRDRYVSLGAVQRFMRRLLYTMERTGTYRIPAYELLLLKRLKKTSNL